MKGQLFGHHLKRRSEVGRGPGAPPNMQEMDRPVKYAHENLSGRSRDAPPDYEGKEHVKYRDPGYSPHHINYPEDEPHMKHNVGREEMHEAEDDYHMDVPHQTHHTLQKQLMRARMKMDAPDQEDPDPLRGNLVHNVGYEGEEDTSGEEEMGPNHMQSDMHKEHRKKMIAAITKRKMKKA